MPEKGLMDERIIRRKEEAKKILDSGIPCPPDCHRAFGGRRLFRLLPRPAFSLGHASQVSHI